MQPHTEAALETVLFDSLLAGGYENLPRDGFDREQAVFPAVVLEFIRETQPKHWEKREALHGAKTSARIIHDLCQSMDTHGSLATLRHGFKCYGRTLRVAFFKARTIESRVGGTAPGHSRRRDAPVALQHPQQELH